MSNQIEPNVALSLDELVFLQSLVRAEMKNIEILQRSFRDNGANDAAEKCVNDYKGAEMLLAKLTNPL